MKSVLFLTTLALFGPKATDCSIPAVYVDLKNISTSVDLFAETYGRLPTQNEGFTILHTAPPVWTNAKPWVPHLRSGPPTDPWKNLYVYVNDPKLKQGYGIYSMGRDGITRSEGHDRDDASTWNTKQLLADHAAYRKRKRDEEELREWIMLIALVVGFITVFFVARKKRRARLELERGSPSYNIR
ncbi:MAG: type II secretion system protein GspG [Verrucomicrobiota bacterium]